ncbi:kinase-like domain protein [Rutstroemia sp. NJR-2017a WRK4]|nr:kinase-like domain protein [Rutstroemia sp. NJR-2017a WRK4]
MEDSTLIARLYPAEDDNGNTLHAIGMPANKSRYIPSPKGLRYEVRSRESTVSESGEDYDPTIQPGLQLTFNFGPKAGNGLVFGTDENFCDIVLPQFLKKISRHHCYLTFDEKRRLILRDISRHGTIVRYDGEGGEKRQNIVTRHEKGESQHQCFTWILSGAGVPDESKNIVIEIQGIKFEIIVSKYNMQSDFYKEIVDQFLARADANERLPFGALHIRSTNTTATQSGTQTPQVQLQTPVYLRLGVVGSGQFSTVYCVWNVSTGMKYAAKEFRETEDIWRREVSIMKKISKLSNAHIVEFIGLLESPTPQLLLEYLPLGSLQDQHSKEHITKDESIHILCQGLDALTSIHREGIVHRDIKPENILVQSRYPLCIKLADFGLSTATDNLRTFCGTDLYAAPEIYDAYHTMYYTNACDIWSFGVVIFKFAYGPLPDLHKEDLRQCWCNKIILRLQDSDSDPLASLLLNAMVVMKPEQRYPANDCWTQALKISTSSKSHCLTPTPASRELVQLKTGHILGEKQTMENGTDLISSIEDQEDQCQARSSTGAIEGLKIKRKETDSNICSPLSPKRGRQSSKTSTQVSSFDIFGANWLEVEIQQDIEDGQLQPEGHSLPRFHAFSFETIRDPIDPLNVHLTLSTGNDLEKRNGTNQIPPPQDDHLQPEHSPQQATQVILFKPTKRHVCAKDILMASSKKDRQCASILGCLGIVSVFKNNYISYEDGIYVGKALKLRDTSLKLLSKAMDTEIKQVEIPIEKPEDTTNSMIVHILLKESQINACNLIAVLGKNRSHLPQLLNDCGIEGVRCFKYGMLGTYVSYHDGICICGKIGILPESIIQIKEAMQNFLLSPRILKQQVKHIFTEEECLRNFTEEERLDIWDTKGGGELNMS